MLLAVPTVRATLLASCRRATARKYACFQSLNTLASDSKSKAALNDANTNRPRTAAVREAAKSSARRKKAESSLTRKRVSAFCAAERYDILASADILRGVGYAIDPVHTGLFPQVLHVQMSAHSPANDSSGRGDVFIFPTGTIVAWNVDDDVTEHLARKGLVPAAESSHLDQLETEDLDFVEDPKTDRSKLVGDTIVLGTKVNDNIVIDMLQEHSTSPMEHRDQQHEANLIMAKIAFSSGLARSVKLAVLENSLDIYFQSTQDIPNLMAKGVRLPFSRRVIAQRTGELLRTRAQLNLNSELTDSIPDMFWDTKHELGLENYFEQVGRALDIRTRSRVLNQKMDYAQEIAAVLREQLSERHGFNLEWLIIVLIASELGFEIYKLYKEHHSGAGTTSTVSDPPLQN